ncbi:MAG: hypothetical protein CL569_15015 [Alphaproteobacteria bacterium]|nr:hypothetical protein [Alphaproteobacteria bacterium]
MVSAARAGQSLEQMKGSITLDKYKDWGAYADWRELNIVRIVRIHSPNRAADRPRRAADPHMPRGSMFCRAAMVPMMKTPEERQATACMTY